MCAEANKKDHGEYVQGINIGGALFKGTGSSSIDGAKLESEMPPWKEVGGGLDIYGVEEGTKVDQPLGGAEGSLGGKK